VILGISIVLWAMMTFPQLDISGSVDPVVAGGLVQDAGHAPDQSMDPGVAALRHSIAGRMGMAMENVTRYAGFDWQTNIALVGGFAAKEVVVSTLGTAYSLGEVDPEDSTSLAQRLKTADGWGPITAFSLILFTIFYSPCFVAVVCIVRESGSWKWGVFSMVFNTLLALSLSIVFYQTATWMMS
jgi:ferrous iron transport protein B